MKLFKKKCLFEKSLKILSEKGFTREYADSLRSELAGAEREKDIAKGKSFLANALLIIGNMNEAYSVFESIDMKKLEPRLRGNLVSSMVFLKFAQNDFKTADELYKTYNAEILGEHSDASKRSLAIHLHINGRYETAVEIYAKMMDSQCRFLDICLVKAMLRLDMYERAAELSPCLERYKDCGELGKETEKLRKKILEKLPKNKRSKK